MGQSTCPETREHAFVKSNSMDSDYYKTRYTYDAGRNKVWKAICEYLSKYVPEGSTVLDLGSGYCDFINNIKARSKFAVDADRGSGEFCNEDVRFINQNVTDIEFEENKFDIIFASNLLEHLTDKELDILLPKITKILKKTGKLILIQPNYYYTYREYWDDYTHKKAFSHHSLTDFISSKNLKILRVEKKFLPFTFKSILPKSYLLTTLYLNFPWRPFAGQMLLIAEK